MNDDSLPHGIYPMLYAFFNARGGLDSAGTLRLVQAFVAHGAHGMAVLGLDTEVNRLADAQRGQLVDWVAEELGMIPASDIFRSVARRGRNARPGAVSRGAAGNRLHHEVARHAAYLRQTHCRDAPGPRRSFRPRAGACTECLRNALRAALRSRTGTA